MKPAHLLVVEDDPAQRTQLAGFLRELGHDVAEAEGVPAARSRLDAGGVDVVVTDLRVGDGDGVELLRWARERHPLVDFIVVTAFGSVETAVEAMRLGAGDFLTKPIHLDVLESRLEKLLAARRLVREVEALRELVRERIDVAGVVAESPAMQRVLQLVRKVAPTDSTVLVTGESGTGKEVVADLLHAWSGRRDGPLVRVNCGALPETLLESTLFGHRRGAFTGADEDRPGLFVEAEGGTLFLDEIGEVSPAVQVKLLRVLQEREVTPVGAARPRPVDVRIVAATNRDLHAEVQAGRFRQDLLFRLNVIAVELAPLRERREDLEALVPLLVRRYADETGQPPPRLSREAHELLLRHRFPGNVRELQNVLQRAVILCVDGVVRAADLPPSLTREDPAPEPTFADETRSLPDLVEQLERTAIQRALRRHGGVRVRAAAALGISERVLRYKLDLYDIDPRRL